MAAHLALHNQTGCRHGRGVVCCVLHTTALAVLGRGCKHGAANCSCGRWRKGELVQRPTKRQHSLTSAASSFVLLLLSCRSPLCSPSASAAVHSYVPTPVHLSAGVSDGLLGLTQVTG
jgi:hypothetical protein